VEPCHHRVVEEPASFERLGMCSQRLGTRLRVWLAKATLCSFFASGKMDREIPHDTGVSDSACEISSEDVAKESIN
jgi:hypothetical protein